MFVFIPNTVFVEGNTEDNTPEKRLDAIIRLAELCIDLLQQNEEHHAEVIMKCCIP